MTELITSHDDSTDAKPHSRLHGGDTMTTTLEDEAAPRAPRPLPDGCVLTTQDLASLIDVPEKTIEWWRRERRGPTPIHVGRHVRYRSEDVRKWLADLADAGERWMAS